MNRHIYIFLIMFSFLFIFDTVLIYQTVKSLESISYEITINKEYSDNYYSDLVYRNIEENDHNLFKEIYI